MKNSWPQEYHYILAHKPFKDMFGDRSLRTFISDNGTPNTVQFDNGGLDTRVFGELPAWKYVASQIDDNDIAALEHYRRKLPLSIQQVILPQPLQVKDSLLDQIGFYHSPKICDALCKILSEKEIEVLKQRNTYSLLHF